MSENKVPTITAMDVINSLRARYVALPEEARYADLSGFVEETIKSLDEYDLSVAEDQVRIQALNKEQASDKVLNAVATKYGITLNQVAGFMDMAEQMNRGVLEGTGVVVVPYWFHEQFHEIKALNASLTEETENLMETLSRAHKRAPEMIEMPQRSSIITGNTQPYIPGETGPRIGDEHLDSGFDHKLPL